MAEGCQQLMGSPGERQGICREPRLVFCCCFFPFGGDLTHALHANCKKTTEIAEMWNNKADEAVVTKSLFDVN